MDSVNLPNLRLLKPLFVWIIIFIITIYFLPRVLAPIVFIAFILNSLSKPQLNYLWLAILFFLVDPSQDLFPKADPKYGLHFTLLPIYLTFQEIWIYSVLIYYLLKRKLIILPYYINIYRLIFVYIILLLIYSFYIGMSMSNFMQAIKFLIPLSLLIILPNYINSAKQWENFFYLIFTISIITFAYQLIQISLGYPLSHILGKPEFKMTAKESSFDGQNFSRPISSSFIVMMSFIGAMYYRVTKKSTFNKTYLDAIIYINFFSIFLTATRGWIIAFVFALFTYLFMINRNSLKRNFASLTVLGLIMILYLSDSISIKSQIEGSWTRFNTLGLIIEGDETAGGTLSRIDTYTPTLMKYFYQKPFMGWGFSDVFWEINNTHVGHPNVLMQSGVIGYSLFVILWLALIISPIILYYRNPIKKTFKPYLVLSLGISISIIIHSSSVQLYELPIGYYNTSFGLLILLSFIDFGIRLKR